MAVRLRTRKVSRGGAERGSRRRAAPKRIWLFEAGNASMRDLLGGKGAGLAEMSRVGLAVPPGFTITTAVCNDYRARGRELPPGLMEEVRRALGQIERKMGKRFGDPRNH